MTKDGFTKKMIINVTISLIIIIGITLFVIIPSSKSLRDSKNKIEQLRINLEKKYLEGQGLKKISESLKEVEDELPKIDEIFIKKSDAIGFITSLENTAQETNIEQRINLTEANSGNYQKNSLWLYTNGAFSNQLDYLSKLETMNYYINIKSMEITKGPVAGDISMQILSDTYWIND